MSISVRLFFVRIIIISLFIRLSPRLAFKPLPQVRKVEPLPASATARLLQMNGFVPQKFAPLARTHQLYYTAAIFAAEHDYAAPHKQQIASEGEVRHGLEPQAAHLADVGKQHRSQKE